jgi:hypothetical protein
MTPKQSQIALWTALFSWALAVLAFLFGATAEWAFQLLMFALLIVLSEWVYGN